MKKAISIDEVKQIQLTMLKEIDAFCRKNEIRYSLAFGTLLGAVRHNGYIPWDDDVDISMPLEDMIRFKSIFKSETLEYVDADVDSNYSFAFSRIAYKPTYSQDGLIVKSYGICIDLYPLIEVSSDLSTMNTLFSNGLRIEHIHEFIWKWNARIIKYLPIRSIPFKRLSVLKLRDYYFNKIQIKGGGRFYFLAGPMEIWEKHSVLFNPFDEMQDGKFESLDLKIPARYDEILTIRYGDYLQLPPEDQRHPYHCANYYWKD